MSEKKINPDNIEAFSSKEVSSLENALKLLKIQEGKVLETPPIVYEILWRFYKDENILLSQIKYLGWKDFQVWFVFPEYKLWKKWLEHISWVQMTLARFQSLYTWIILSIKQWTINSELSYDVCLRNMCNVLYRGWTITHRKVLFPWEVWTLTLRIDDVLKKWPFYTIQTEFVKTKDCFLFWKETCVLEDRFVNLSD